MYLDVMDQLRGWLVDPGLMPRIWTVKDKLKKKSDKFLSARMIQPTAWIQFWGVFFFLFVCLVAVVSGSFFYFYFFITALCYYATSICSSSWRNCFRWIDLRHHINKAAIKHKKHKINKLALPHHRHLDCSCLTRIFLALADYSPGQLSET